MKKIRVNLDKNLYSLDERDWQSLYSKGFGEKIGEIFCLNVYEVLFLVEKGKIEVFSKSGNILVFKDIIKKNKVDFNIFLTFADLIGKGYNVKSGLRYGVEFRVYEKGIKVGEKHSEWLVKTFSYKTKTLMSDIASFNRVAHSTKKKFLFAVIDIENCVTYFESNWTKM